MFGFILDSLPPRGAPGGFGLKGFKGGLKGFKPNPLGFKPLFEPFWRGLASRLGISEGRQKLRGLDYIVCLTFCFQFFISFFLMFIHSSLFFLIFAIILKNCARSMVNGGPEMALMSYRVKITLVCIHLGNCDQLSA